MSLKLKGAFKGFTGATKLGDFVEGDPYWDNVQSLHHFDKDLTDEAGTVWTSTSAPVYQPTSKVFGTHSLDMTSGQALYAVDENLWNIGVGGESFTIEFWYYKFANWTDNNQYTILSKSGNVGGWSSSNGNAWWLGSWSNGFIFQYNTGGTFATITSGTLPVNGWVHLAFVNNSSDNTAKVYVNGSQFHSTTAISISKPTTAAYNIIGDAKTTTLTPSFCMFDEMRITKGVARYTSDFTVPTAEFPNF